MEQMEKDCKCSWEDNKMMLYYLSSSCHAVSVTAGKHHKFINTCIILLGINISVSVALALVQM